MGKYLMLSLMSDKEAMMKWCTPEVTSYLSQQFASMIMHRRRKKDLMAENSFTFQIGFTERYNDQADTSQGFAPATLFKRWLEKEAGAHTGVRAATPDGPSVNAMVAYVVEK